VDKMDLKLIGEREGVDCMHVAQVENDLAGCCE